MNSRRPIVFPHVPKCGGTSILQAIRSSGARIFLDYDHPPSLHPYFSQLVLDRDADFQILDFSPFDIVFGHFPLCRYSVERSQTVMLLRNPVERAISQFLFWRDIMPATPTNVEREPAVAMIKSGAMDFRAFVEQCEMPQFFQRYVGLIDTRDCLLVGFTDQLDRFSKNFEARAGIHLGKIGWERRNDAHSDFYIDDEIFNLFSDELAWYAEQRSIWENF